MSEQRVADLVAGTPAEGQFLVVRKELRQGGRAGMFLDCILCDATGRVPAKIWERAGELNGAFQQGDVISIRGLAESYRGEIQLRLDAVRLVPAEIADPSQFLPRSKKDPAALAQRLAEVVDTIADPLLRTLVTTILNDPEVAPRFFVAPGAKSLHHAYIVGLAEHTCEVVELCLRVAEVFPQLDRDLLLATAILHDVGKLDELSWNTAFEYTDAGMLVGHIVLGERRVWAVMDAIPDFPEELKLRVSHMMLSHHGIKEYGSPVEPVTAEAIALHHAEDLDAKVNLFLTNINTAREQGKRWTDRHFALGRALYAGDSETAPDLPRTPSPKLPE